MQSILLLAVVFMVFLQMGQAIRQSASSALPPKTVGFYLLLADDTVANYTSDSQWQPVLFDYQKSGANVLYFTFINPSNMKVPPAFTNLAKTIADDTTVMFAVGGYSYSLKPNPWPFLASADAARSMAKEVATWSEKYGCDGIDLDIETGAGDATNAGENLFVFIETLKSLNPKMIITQPVFGYPQVKAETYVVNEAWKASKSQALVDAIGIMVYSGSTSLQYVKNYANGTSQWQGFPIHVDVPSTAVVAGMGGNADQSTLNVLVDAVINQNLRGLMVWYASVKDSATNKPAIQYAGGGPDASNKATTAMWKIALDKLK
eukprot:g2488.t1